MTREKQFIYTFRICYNILNNQQISRAFAHTHTHSQTHTVIKLLLLIVYKQIVLATNTILGLSVDGGCLYIVCRDMKWNVLQPNLNYEVIGQQMPR
jgi:hypothetical protein